MHVKLSILYQTVVTHIPTYPLPKASGNMIACPICGGRIVISPADDMQTCLLDTCCHCNVVAAIRDRIFIPDRQQRRRDYIWYRAEALVMTALRRCIVVAMLTASLACFVVAYRIRVDLDAYVPLSGTTVTVLGNPISNGAGREAAENIAGIMTLAGWLGIGGTWLVWNWMNIATMGQKPVPYAPPATIENFPAREILVRAAEEPPIVQSEVLVRASQEQATPKEELLRMGRD